MKKFSQIKVKNIDIENVQTKMNNLIEEFITANSFKEQDQVFKKINKYTDDLSTDISIIQVRFTLNTQDKKYKKMQDHLDEVLPYLSSIINKFNKCFIESKFKEDFKKKYGTYIFDKIECQMKCFDEKIIPELQKINKLTSEYSNVLASAKIEFEGNTYNLPQMNKFANSLDHEIRKKAAIATSNFFKDNDQKIGEIYDELVKTRTLMAQKLGYKNFIELGYYMLGRTSYNAKDVEGYRNQIYNDLVPLTNKLFKDQAKRIGINNPQYYDYVLQFKDGNPKPHGNKDFMVEKAMKMYSELSSETDYFFHFMNDYELMDLEAKPGKTPGGYMTYFPKYKAPFIFSNFNGTSGEVDVLTHEFGHAFQGYMSSNIKVPDYRSPTLEACEIHSMSMEFFTYPWMNLFFEEEERKYKFSHILNAITFIPYGVTIDEFQHFVYEHPEATHEERCKEYKRIEEKYLPHKKYKDVEIYDKGRFWMKQSHVFSSPFYYIDYTLAQVVAFEFFTEDLKNHEKAWKKYVKLCKLGGKYPFQELLNKAGLKNPFIDGTVKKIVSPLKKFIKEFDEFK